VLEHDTDPELRALVHRRIGDVLALEYDLTARDPVLRHTRYGKKQRGLARAVGPEQGVGLPVANGHIDVVQYALVVYFDGQILDTKHESHTAKYGKICLCYSKTYTPNV
jgi:hypothetical protein